MAEPALWLAGWSDSEDEDFRAACAEAGMEAAVARVAPLGPTVGTRRHRLRSWPAYVRQARRALRWPGPVVAWDPIAGAIAARLGRRERLVILNPILDPSRKSRRQQLVVSGARRAGQVLFFSRAGARDGLELGVRGAFVPLGVRARRDEAAPPGDHVLAVGRDHRDWETLARAAQALDIEVRVIGPATVPGPLRLVDPVPREELFGLMEQAAAVVVPLMDDRRTTGQLAVLDAFAVGRGVVATKCPGTEDYVTDDTGFLVPPGEADALRAALGLAADPNVAASQGRAALAAARGPLSLTTFVSTVDAAARETSP
ncbi:MAG TPA: glycosyltransferase [Gaiellaceae bacterium]|nr:glycosyltransferase [Gaiellaceae bacterium]